MRKAAGLAAFFLLLVILSRAKDLRFALSVA